MLNRFDHIPDGLLSCEANQLHDFLGGPSLIDLPGRREAPLFVSVLMHGNETTGWDAVRELLKTVYTAEPEHCPRSLMLFIANTEAAKHNVRHLPDQADFNRVWPGSELEPGPEHQLMNFLTEELKGRRIFASIDIHNNTGLNPHYACVNSLDSPSLKLATLFSRTVVYFIRPTGVQSMAMSKLCPAVTLECGKVEHKYGFKHTLSYLNACVHLEELLDTPVADHDIDLFHTTATVKIPQGVRFGFSGDNLDLRLPSKLERYNFRELPEGTDFAALPTQKSDLLDVTNESGKAVFQDYFRIESGVIKTQKKVMPSMLTKNLEVIRQDCLCYLMERYALPGNTGI